MKTPTSFEAAVNGPYVVAVVCDRPPDDLGISPVVMTQRAATPDDPRVIDGHCSPRPNTHLLSGHMVQPGFIHVAESTDRSTVADWDFALEAVNGSYDLVAASDLAIAVRRGIKVDGDTHVDPDVDVDQEGQALVDVSFTAANPEPGESLSVAVGILTATNPDVPAQIYDGTLAEARVAPDSALVATDTQSVSVRARNGNAVRALRRPFRAGGDTAFTLPPAIQGLAWTADDQTFAASWTSLPPFDTLSVDAFGSPTTSRRAVDYQLSASSSFLATTGGTTLAIDTELPGFKPEWKLDFTDRYQRLFTAQQGKETAVLTTSMTNEIVNGPLETDHPRIGRTRP
ncbi:MAG TPA: hypothetical protein VFT22_10100 [Kofleriaceae bacterium]|nr:hypothetical protein [Kofleriaceae bacterium]